MTSRIMLLALCSMSVAIGSLGVSLGNNGSFEIAPGVWMPWLSNGAIDYPSTKTEQAGLELWLKAGGRGVDTAWLYNNQVQVGYAIGNTSVPRNEIFLTTKIPCMNSSAATMEIFKECLALLNQKYVDLVLIHEPDERWGGVCKTAADRQSTWRGLQQALAAGLTRSIGVSNFNSSHISDLMSMDVKPAVNQCNVCVGHHDDNTIEYCKANNITFEAYSPLGGADLGGKSVLNYPEVQQMAAAHNVSAAQVGLRWVLQQGIGAVTATGNVDHMNQDLAVTGFELTEAEMKTLHAISKPPPGQLLV